MLQDKLQATAPSALTGSLELKSLSADGRFAGYASVFGNLDSQHDVVHPGAFRRSLKERREPVKLLWQHRWDAPIGTVDAIFEDAHGLYVEGTLLMEVAQAREAHALLKAGVLKGLSIGYSVKSFRRDPDSGARELLDIELWEVSLVTLPANPAAKVTVLKSAEAMGPRDIAGLERAMRHAHPLTKSADLSSAARTRLAALLEDMAHYCLIWRVRQLETKTAALARKDYDGDDEGDDDAFGDAYDTAFGYDDTTYDDDDFFDEAYDDALGYGNNGYDDEGLGYPGASEPPLDEAYGLEGVIGSLGALTAEAALGAVGEMSGAAASTGAYDDVIDSIGNYFGGQPDKTFRNKAGDLIMMGDGKQVRFNIERPHGYDPHFHVFEQDEDGNFVDAGDQHMYFFEDGD